MNPKGDSIADAIPHKSTTDHPPLPCRPCGTLTSRATLAAHGAQCYPCYAAYCRVAFNPRPPSTDTQTVADMKTRVKAGFRFSSLQEHP